MAIQSTTQITIKGTPLKHFERFFLNQSITDHHFFEVVVRLDEFAMGGIALESTQDLIGEQITVTTGILQGLGSFNESLFVGLVTEVSNNLSHHGNKNTVTIKGYSPTLVIDSSPNCSSHIKKTLSDIIENALSEYQGNTIKKEIQPNHSQTLPYTVQYNETDYQFINRLAHAHGEWFYYDGSKLIFGQTQSETVPLSYGYDLHEFNLSVNINNPKFNLISNDYLEAKEEQFDAAGVNVNMNGLNGNALTKSDKVFTKTPSAMNNRHFTERQTKRELEQAAEIQKKAQVGKMVVLKGSSDNPGVQLGGTINIIDAVNSGPKPFGEYRITSVSHQCNSLGHYKNYFEAVPIAVTVPPYANVSLFPDSESQSAIVKDNKDPEGLKRLKVQFAWQKPTGETTPWVRMLTPHAGGGKGFYFVPEIGEEVMVGFEGGNAEKPYIMGTKFNAQAKSNFYDKDNNIKGLQTRSGNKVVMNDKDGSVTIADPSGNTIVMHGNGDISISAPNTLNISATDININAGNSINIKSEPAEEGGGAGTITVKAKDEFKMSSQEKKIDLVAKENITVVSTDKSINLVAQQENVAIVAETGLIALDGKKEVSAKSSKNVTITGGAKVAVKGGKVQINKG